MFIVFPHMCNISQIRHRRAFREINTPEAKTSTKKTICCITKLLAYTALYTDLRSTSVYCLAVLAFSRL